MKKVICLFLLLILALYLYGCNSGYPEESAAETYPVSISVGEKTFSVQEINAGIQKAFRNDLYYNSGWDNGCLSDKVLVYELYYNHEPSSHGQKPIVFLIITNVEHPMSTEDIAYRYIFGIRVSEVGLQTSFFTQHKVTDTDHFGMIDEDALYLGEHSISTKDIQQPEHEQMSDQWKQNAEAELCLYMDKNDFYQQAEKNLQPGKYNVYIQGFSESDDHTRVIFEHENGQVYQGTYYFVHNVTGETPADLNHVEPMDDPNTAFMDYLNKVRIHAAFSMEYVVK